MQMLSSCWVYFTLRALILHAKDAFKTILEEDEEAEEDYYAGEGGSVDFYVN